MYTGVLSSYEMVEERGCIKDDLISRFAYGIVKHSLTNKADLVREYFEKNPVGCYCPLLKQILGSKYVAPMQKPKKNKMETSVTPF